MFLEQTTALTQHDKQRPLDFVPGAVETDDWPHHLLEAEEQAKKWPNRKRQNEA